MKGFVNVMSCVTVAYIRNYFMFLSTSLYSFSFYVSIKTKGALTASVQCTKGKEIQI